ncbi:glycosyltransferase [Vreelandella azerica]|uniref:glycosyltransferase n=1 Tax=Vreelandella azerica TaxID=2732867 RepID=UPI002E2B5F59|nr:glycosyltransferase [Halomonas azerica]
MSYLAKKTYAAFPQAFGSRAEVIGNPVRDEIGVLGEHPRQAEDMRGRPLRLLVVGGSLGAVALNERLPPALAELEAVIRPEVWHQAGKNREEAVRERYAEYAVEARVSAFIDDMAAAYQWADLVVCRSGALTVAELAAAAKPALFVPFPHAVDDHQTVNAQALVSESAAVCVIQSELTQERLLSELKQLLSPDVLAAKAANARRAAYLDATERLMQGCLMLADKEHMRD